MRQTNAPNQKETPERKTFRRFVLRRRERSQNTGSSNPAASAF
ncbi:hypothetical protein HMPREF9120_02691 [Neisseria sp. oral taxon 020 str. F0370]|nr:hypothetical protein HMPREF9120_02691 [Neisseria sp. oral taxon 020 str. F0370]